MCSLSRRVLLQVAKGCTHLNPHVLEPLMHLLWLTPVVTSLLPTELSYLPMWKIAVKALLYDPFLGLLHQTVWGIIATSYQGDPLTCWWVQHRQQIHKRPTKYEDYGLIESHPSMGPQCVISGSDSDHCKFKWLIYWVWVFLPQHDIMMIIYYINSRLIVSTNLFLFHNFHIVKHIIPQPQFLIFYVMAKSVIGNFIAFNQLTLKMDQSSSIYTFQSSLTKPKKIYFQKLQESWITLE